MYENICGVCNVSSSLHLMTSSDFWVDNDNTDGLVIFSSIAWRNVSSNGLTCLRSSNKPNSSQLRIKPVGVGVSSTIITKKKT